MNVSDNEKFQGMSIKDLIQRANFLLNKIDGNLTALEKKCKKVNR